MKRFFPLVFILASPAAVAAGDPVVMFNTWFSSPGHSSLAYGNVIANGPNGPYTSRLEARAESSHQVLGGEASMLLPLDSRQAVKAWARAGAAEGEVVASSRFLADPSLGPGWIFAGSSIARVQSRHFSVGSDWARAIDFKTPVIIKAGLGLGYTRGAMTEIGILPGGPTFVYPTETASGLALGGNLLARLDLSRETRGRVGAVEAWVEKAPWGAKDAEGDHIASPWEIGVAAEIPFSNPLSAGSILPAAVGVNGNARVELATIRPDASIPYKSGFRVGLEASAGPATLRVDHVAGLTTTDDISNVPEGNYGFGHFLAAYHPSKPWLSYLPGTHVTLKLATRQYGEFALTGALRSDSGSAGLQPGVVLRGDIKERMIGVSWKMQF